MARNVSGDNLNSLRTDRQAQGGGLSLRPEQLGLSLLTAHPIRFQQGRLAAEKERSTCSSLRQHGDDPRATGRSGFQHQLKHQFRPTEVINSEDEDYDLDLPGFPRFPVFPPGEGTLFSTSALTSRSLMEKRTSRGSSASSAMPIAPDDAQMSNDKFHHITSATLLTWSGTSQSTKRQAPTWLSPWLI